MKHSIILLSLFLGIPTFMLAQERIPVGTWRSHFNYQNTILVEQAGDKFYGASSAGLIFYDSEDNSLNKFSKIDGLSDVGFSAMTYDGSLGCLALGYDNGNVDLIKEGEILNVTAIKRSNITGSKKINAISFFEGLAYLATDFGVLVLDPSSGEIKEAYQNLGVAGQTLKIRGTTFAQGRIYVAAQTGVLSGELTTNVNLQDFNNWERFEGSTVNGLEIVSIDVFDGQVYAATNLDIHVFDGTTWAPMGLVTSGATILKVRQSAAGLVIVLSNGLKQLSTGGSVSDVAIESGDAPNDALRSNGNVLWYADQNNGLTRYENGSATRFVPNGVFNGLAVKLEWTNEKILAFPESRTSGFLPMNNQLGFASFDGSWTQQNPGVISGFDDVTDFAVISEDKTVISSYDLGILNISDGTVYDDGNSPLHNLGSSSEKQVTVTAMETDGDGNLWVANVGDNSLLRLDAQNEWQSFGFSVAAASRPEDLHINSLGHIWMVLTPEFGGGILAYEPDTDFSRYINASNGSLPSTQVTDLEFDKNDQIWIGTESGIAYFPFARGVIGDNSIDVIRPVFGNRFLLEEEFISAIDVDEGNRKWIGTRDGLWLFEDAGEEQVLNFTVDNSPLPSNNILDIASNPMTGEVFIATDRGLVSYSSDATTGRAFHQNVRIFPNPVQPGYTGLVGISGLANDAILKITNVSGRLVREIHAAGGGASWDLSDYNGRRAQSGVYLVFSATSDGSETFVGKIAIIN